MRVAVGMFVGILIVVGALQASVVGERLNYSALDATQRLVRALAPRPALENIVIVGIDKGTERSFPEPFALWHRHLGEALSAIARGQPKLVALDIVLPERSYDALVPGLTADLGADYAVGAGGAVHGHPMGAAGGARAIRQAIDATAAGRTLADAAREHPELAAALAAWPEPPPGSGDDR